MVIEEECF